MPHGLDLNSAEKKALAVFQSTAQRVPAYTDFLKKNKILPEKIQSMADFSLVPPVTKENYLREYPLKDLLLDGSTEDAWAISMSSGSSGTPFTWFRGKESAEQAITLFGRILEKSFDTKSKETLCIIAFAMGTWIGGTYSFAAFQELAAKGHHIVSISPGINISEILLLLQNLAPQFEQTLLVGYPPFVKDILDEASKEPELLQKAKLRLLFAGENFSEEWRDYVYRKTGALYGELYSSASIYGTADAGILGHETPFSLKARRLIAETPKLRQSLFPHISLLPTLVEYDPEIRFFQTIEDRLIFTTGNSLPLVRYEIYDRGELMDGETLAKLIEKETSAPLLEELTQFRSHSHLALYGRSDISTTFYALDIYPENIKYGLEHPSLEPLITGKFILTTEYDESQQQSLHLYIELRPEVAITPTQEDELRQLVIGSMRKNNSEYNKLVEVMQAAAYPIIHLKPHRSPEFTITIKHRWVASKRKTR